MQAFEPLTFHQSPARLYEQADSTNRLALEWAREGAPHGALVMAKTQLSGRGRTGRGFESPPGGLYMSVVLDAPADKIGQITTLAGVAVCRAADSLRGIPLRIKWVNDCMKDGLKAGGILAEGLMQLEKPKTVVGIGVNLSPLGLSQDLQGKAGALFEDISPITPLELAKKIHEELLQGYPLMPGHMREYRQRCLTLGKQVAFPWQGQQRTGIAANVLDSGALVVEMDSLVAGEPREHITLLAGEVSVRSPSGAYW